MVISPCAWLNDTPAVVDGVFGGGFAVESELNSISKTEDQ